MGAYKWRPYLMMLHEAQAGAAAATFDLDRIERRTMRGHLRGHMRGT